MKWLDTKTEHISRRVVQTTSRRSLLVKISAILLGSSLAPILPVMRVSSRENMDEGNTKSVPDPGDPTKCDYWRNCAVDGFLCSCCGGTVNSCPPGTEMSPITWIGTCKNPADGLDYIISYNDCCGKVSCGSCYCNRNEGDTPLYRPQTANSIVWCLGTASTTYNCTVTIILGVATNN